MNIYGPDFFDDDALIAEIKAYAKGKRDVMMGDGVAVIAGEGRRVEFTRSSAGDLDAALREMLYEARSRGLSIGGEAGGALLVEIG